MHTKNSLELQASHNSSALSACWKLMPGRAISLQPRNAGVLHMVQGQVWATFDGPHAGHGNESGDCFLRAGEAISIRAGQRLVMESWTSEGEVPVYFEWTPAPALMALHASRWKTAVLQRLQDWGLGLQVAERKTPAAVAL